ncbi:major facilitator superfamily domain-containing protein 6-like [Littorina saxatilis]|uniref:major facilitator superfamily domain-containing protein 6-like n=1 Tax=Littorina saxatilis TaxID=31220 RepID=UPI0038B54678
MVVSSNTCTRRTRQTVKPLHSKQKQSVHFTQNSIQIYNRKEKTKKKVRKTPKHLLPVRANQPWLHLFLTDVFSVKGESLVKNVLKIVIVPEVAAFLVVVLYVGMLSGALQGFLFWYLADLGASPLLFGLCLAVNCLFEIPFFFISGSFINRFGTIACLSCTLLVLSARFMAYSLLSNAWHVLFIEWVHGLTFGVTWSAVTTHASSISPPGLTATTQGLVSGLNFGIGKGLGSLLTGALFSKIGARWTFRALSITCVCLGIVHVTLHRCVFHGKALLMPDGKDKAYTTGATDKEQQAQNKSLLIPDINC